MRTYLEFISTLQLLENQQQELAQLRAKIRTLQSRGRPGDAEEIKRLIQRAGEMQVGTQAKISALTNNDKPKGPANPNTKVRGYASKPKDVVSSTGSLSNVDKTNIPTPSDERISGLHGDTRSRSQRGGSVPTRNKGQGYSSPERSSHSRS
jgi:hypothetical protein